jgi:hypothetical protein
LAKSLQGTTGFGDEKIQDSMTKLINITGEYNAALKGTAAVTEMAAATGMDLETAATLVGRAYNGNGEMLKRYGIYLSEGVKGEAVLQEIAAKFAGSAAARMETLEGKTALMKERFSDLGEVIGNTLLPETTEWVDMLNNSMEYWTNLMAQEGGIPVISGMMIGIRWITDVGIPVLINAFDVFFSRLQAHPLEAIFNPAKFLGSVAGEASILTNELQKNFAASLEPQDLPKIGAKKGGAAGTSGEGQNAAEIMEITDALDEYNAKIAEAQKLTEQLGDAFGELGRTAAETNFNIAKSAAAAGKAMLISVIDFFEAKFRLSMADATLNLFNPLLALTAPGQMAAAGAGIAVAEGLKAKIAKMASGGIATSPQFAMIGEAGPEAVIPLNQLQPMINNAVNNSSYDGRTTIVINGLFNENTVRRELEPILDNITRNRGRT